jgi:hypothetical protein
MKEAVCVALRRSPVCSAVASLLRAAVFATIDSVGEGYEEDGDVVAAAVMVDGSD